MYANDQKNIICGEFSEMVCSFGGVCVGQSDDLFFFPFYFNPISYIFKRENWTRDIERCTFFKMLGYLN